MDLRAARQTLQFLTGIDPGRGIHWLAHLPEVRDDLWQAASHISGTAHPAVAIVTGFFIPHAPVPAAETDGPAGAALLAGVLATLDVSVSVITDEPCAPVVTAALAACPQTRALRPVVLPVGPLAVSAIAALVAANYGLPRPVTHLIFIERVGPSALGHYHSMAGVRLDGHVAPLELLLAPHVTSIGIGDGGNEIGMGKLPAGLLAAHIPHASRIACVTPTDWLIASGTSNWGAFGLATALGLLAGARAGSVHRILAEEEVHRDIMRAMLGAGAVDGVTGLADLGTDGLAWNVYAAIPRALNRLLHDHLQHGTPTPPVAPDTAFPDDSG